jgi:hypothetical protein
LFGRVADPGTRAGCGRRKGRQASSVRYRLQFTTTELDGEIGFQGAFEFRVTDRLGIEPGVSILGYDLTVEEPGFPDLEGETDLIGLTVNFNFHFERDSGLDCYVGPTVGYALWDDIELNGFSPVPTDDEVLFGVNGGLDFPVGDGGWAFHAGLSYLFFDLAAAGGDIGVSPLQLELGLSYDF